VYATDAPTKAQESAVRRAIAALVAAGQAERDPEREGARRGRRVGRHGRVHGEFVYDTANPAGVVVRRPMTETDHEARAAVLAKYGLDYRQQ